MTCLVRHSSFVCVISAGQIGVDLDNTLIIYDDLLKKLAFDRNLLIGIFSARPRFRERSRSAMRCGPGRTEKSSGKNCRPTPTAPPSAKPAWRPARTFLDCPEGRHHRLHNQPQDRIGEHGSDRHEPAAGGVGLDGGPGLFADSAGLSPAKVFFGATRAEKIAISASLAAPILSTTWKRPSRKRPFLPASSGSCMRAFDVKRPPGGCFFRRNLGGTILEADL